MRRVLAWEAPDLVVYSGDQVTGENVDSNATAYWLRAVQPCLDAGTPWAAVFGNHGGCGGWVSSKDRRAELR